MIAANAALFARLAGAVGDLVATEVLQQKRAIQTSTSDKRWLQHLAIRASTHLHLSSSARFAIGEMEGQVYLIAIGVDIINLPAELEPIEINAGAFTAIVSELGVAIRQLPDLQERLREYVFYPVTGPHELISVDVVRPLFQSFNLFKIDAASALSLDKELGLRAAIAALLGAPSSLAIAWPDTMVERLNYMIRDPAEKAPFHLLLRSITEFREDAAFLAIYRCIEQLFPIPAIADLSAALGLANPLLEVAMAIEQHLGWRRREEDAISHLFAGLDAALIDRFVPVVGALAGAENRHKPVAKRVYELRNQCVHYRPIHAVDTATFSAWLALSDLMLEAVQQMYATHQAAFATPQPLVVNQSLPA
jgi:hypothetical protein